MPADIPILDIGTLVIDASPRPSFSDRWFDTRVRVGAHPFSGTVETIFTDEDLKQFAEQLEGLGPEGEAVLGGGRACEVRLATEWQNGVTGGLLAVECSVTPSGDDPFPFVRFLIFDVDPSFASTAVASIRDVESVDPWPRP
jgi:hypothetical protein